MTTRALRETLLKFASGSQAGFPCLSFFFFGKIFIPLALIRARGERTYGGLHALVTSITDRNKTADCDAVRYISHHALAAAESNLNNTRDASSSSPRDQCSMSFSHHCSRRYQRIISLNRRPTIIYAAEETDKKLFNFSIKRCWTGARDFSLSA